MSCSNSGHLAHDCFYDDLPADSADDVLCRAANGPKGVYKGTTCRRRGSLCKRLFHFSFMLVSIVGFHLLGHCISYIPVWSIGNVILGQTNTSSQPRNQSSAKRDLQPQNRRLLPPNCHWLSVLC
jgi:hypothetical protein